MKTPDFNELSILDQMDSELNLKEQAEKIESLKALDSLLKSMNERSLDIENPEKSLEKSKSLKEALEGAKKILPEGEELEKLVNTIQDRLARFEAVMAKISNMIKSRPEKKSETLNTLRANEVFMASLNENFSSLKESLGLLADYTKAHTNKDDELVRKTLETLKALEEDGKMDNFQRQFENCIEGVRLGSISVFSPVKKEYFRQTIQLILDSLGDQKDKYQLLKNINSINTRDKGWIILDNNNVENIIQFLFEGIKVIPKIREMTNNALIIFSFLITKDINSPAKKYYERIDHDASISTLCERSKVSYDNIKNKNTAVVKYFSETILINVETGPFLKDYYFGQTIAFGKVLRELNLKLNGEGESVFYNYSVDKNNDKYNGLYSKSLIDIGSGDNLWLYSPDLEDPRNQEILKGYRETMALIEKHLASEVPASTPQGVRSKIADLFKTFEAKEGEFKATEEKLQTELQAQKQLAETRESEKKSTEEKLQTEFQAQIAEMQKASSAELQAQKQLSQRREAELQQRIDQLQSTLNALKSQAREAFDTLEGGNSFGKKGDTIKKAQDILSEALDKAK